MLLPPHSVPAGASLQGAHMAGFVLNMLCLEHRLTSEPASFASIKTWSSPSLKMLRDQAGSPVPHERIQVPRIPKQPTSQSRRGSKFCPVPTAPTECGNPLITQVDSADPSTQILLSRMKATGNHITDVFSFKASQNCSPRPPSTTLIHTHSLHVLP